MVGFVVRCRQSRNKICGRILVGFVVVVVSQETKYMLGFVAVVLRY